ncbi:MAG: TRAP transporter TatT component family protein [Planctomycetota bacterium]
MRFLICFFLLLMIACGNGTEEKIIQEKPKATGEYFDYMNKGNTAFAEKHLAEKNQEALTAFENAYTIQKDDPTLYEKLIRCYYYSAMYHGEQKTKEERIRLLATGKQYGIEGLKLNPQMKQAIEAEKSWDEIASLARRSDVPAMYWLGICWGRWGEIKGITTVAFDIGKVKTLMTKVLELDDSYGSGGADRFFGVFYMEIPNGSPEKAREHFEKAIQLSPDFLQNYILFAQYYCVKKEEQDLFVEMCKEILAREKTLNLAPQDWKIDNDDALRKAKIWITEDYQDEVF